jgi:hypothetical protein
MYILILYFYINYNFRSYSSSVVDSSESLSLSSSIPNHLFTKFISHSKKICNNDILLYHNLINNDEYTELFAFFKSTILYYITLNDFGKLTTVNMMNDILTKKCDIFSDKISMNVLLKCKYKDMFSVTLTFLNIYQRINDEWS